MSKRVVVVGGGPAGMEAAATAAERGHAVTLLERSGVLGGALNWTRRMPLRWEFGTLLDSQRARLDRAGVDVRLGTSGDAAATLEADALIWAIGAAPQGQPLASGGTALKLEAALADPEALGDRVVMVDTLGTWSVVSVAEHLADLGKTVTLVAPTGAPGWTISMYSSFAMRRRLNDKRVRIVAGQALADFDGEAARLTDLSLDAPGEVIAVDSVVAPLAAAPRPVDPALIGGRNTPVQTVSVGDCQSARTALEAVFEGHEAARNL